MKTEKIYLVWHEEIRSEYELIEPGYFSQHDSIKEAYEANKSEDVDIVEIYEAKPVFLGNFKKTTRIVKVK